MAGLGNPLRGDEGVGVRVVEALARRAGAQVGVAGPGPVAYLDLGTGGMRLIDALAGARKAVIVDCARMGRAPGAIARFTPESVRTRKPVPALSMHGGDVMAVLSLAERLGLSADEVVVFGIEPASLAYRDTLSPALAARLEAYADAVAAEL